MTSPVAPVRHSLQQSRLPRDAERERETAFLSFGPSFLSSLCIIVMPHGSRLGYYLSRFCTRLRRSLVTSCVSPEHCIRIASTAHLLSTVFISPFFSNVCICTCFTKETRPRVAELSCVRHVYFICLAQSQPVLLLHACTVRTCTVPIGQPAGGEREANVGAAGWAAGHVTKAGSALRQRVHVMSIRGSAGRRRESPEPVPSRAEPRQLHIGSSVPAPARRLPPESEGRGPVTCWREPGPGGWVAIGLWLTCWVRLRAGPHRQWRFGGSGRHHSSG